MTDGHGWGGDASLHHRVTSADPDAPVAVKKHRAPSKCDVAKRNFHNTETKISSMCKGGHEKSEH